MVLPKWLFTTSPGLMAVPEGRFSVEGMRPMTLSLGLSVPNVSNVPRTAAAPDMSNFMSSMFCAGLIEMPPESNVTPLPTRTTGAASPPPLYSSAMKRGSCTDPCATASSAPIPSFLMAARSSTVTPNPCFLATAAGVPGARRDRLPGAPARFGLFGLLGVDHHVHGLDVHPRLLGGLLHVRKDPGAVSGALHCHLPPVFGLHAVPRLGGSE